MGPDQKREKCPTSCRMAEVDRADIDILVENGVYTHPADAIKGTLRRGIRQDMEERGIKPYRVVHPDETEEVKA